MVNKCFLIEISKNKLLYNLRCIRKFETYKIEISTSINMIWVISIFLIEISKNELLSNLKCLIFFKCLLKELDYISDLKEMEHVK